VAHLKVSNIDRSLMLIHVQQGKGSRDCKLPLTEKVYAALREYWRAAKIKPRVYLFPSRIEARPRDCGPTASAWNSPDLAAGRDNHRFPANGDTAAGPHTPQMAKVKPDWRDDLPAGRIRAPS
jgi:integrase